MVIDKKYIAFLLILCIILSACSCAEKDIIADNKSYTTQSDIPFGEQANLFVYSGENSYTAIFDPVDTDFAKKYIEELKKEGFKKYIETNFDVKEDDIVNTFATYQSRNWVVDLDHHSEEARLYVTYTRKDDRWVLPSLIKPTYTDCGMPTIITQVGAERFHKEDVSMCYIIRAADGSFIIYDSDFGNGMAELIYEILKKQAPDPNNIVISAWVVTHPHLDHVGAFLDFADKYENDETITLQQMVYNYPDDTYVGSETRELMAKTPVAAKKLNENVTFVRPHVGNVLYYANLTFRVLYAQEQYLVPAEGEIKYLNGASLVMQMETDSGVKVLFGSDHPVNGSYNDIPYCDGALHRWYGSYIKSDIVTLFHHGFGGGADLEIYDYIKPSVVLWPATFYRLTHDSDGTPYANIEFNKRNLYFSDPERAKQNGVLGYYISGDKIHIVDLSNKKLEVTEYSHCDEYLAKK